MLQDALSEVTQIYPPLELVKGRNKEVAEKVMKTLKEEVEKKGLKLSVTQKGRE